MSPVCLHHFLAMRACCGQHQMSPVSDTLRPLLGTAAVAQGAQTSSVQAQTFSTIQLGVSFRHYYNHVWVRSTDSNYRPMDKNSFWTSRHPELSPKFYENKLHDSPSFIKTWSNIGPRMLSFHQVHKHIQRPWIQARWAPFRSIFHWNLCDPKILNLGWIMPYVIVFAQKQDYFFPLGIPLRKKGGHLIFAYNYVQNFFKKNIYNIHGRGVILLSRSLCFLVYTVLSKQYFCIFLWLMDLLLHLQNCSIGLWIIALGKLILINKYVCMQLCCGRYSDRHLAHSYGVLISWLPTVCGCWVGAPDKMPPRSFTTQLALTEQISLTDTGVIFPHGWTVLEQFLQGTRGLFGRQIWHSANRQNEILLNTHRRKIHCFPQFNN